MNNRYNAPASLAHGSLGRGHDSRLGLPLQHFLREDLHTDRCETSYTTLHVVPMMVRSVVGAYRYHISVKDGLVSSKPGERTLIICGEECDGAGETGEELLPGGIVRARRLRIHDERRYYEYE